MIKPYDIVGEFEERIAEWAGSRYAVAVESCSAALFLCCEYLKVGEVEIPKHTYPSVPCAIIHAGGRIKFSDEKWSGIYELKPYKIYDGALRFKKGMYQGGYHCVSFHIKKHLPLGRGGMILTDDKKAVEWFKKARFDGRLECHLSRQKDITMLGYNMYMTPEQAVRGIQLFDLIKDESNHEDIRVEEQGYPDLSKCKAYENYILRE